MGVLYSSNQHFLAGIAIVYVFAFSSIYMQFRGLYSDSGLLPARNAMDYDEVMKIDTLGKLMLKLRDRPTLLWILPHLGFTISDATETLCLLGLVVSILLLVFKKLRHLISFAILWIIYLSVYQVGKTFLWFQWDILLLEAGFLTILISPCSFLRTTSSPIFYWLIKWLLFRLMFASGVVKLTSGCPTWWGLTALDWHYESQCIPTPLAWYAHQLPHWVHALSTAIVYVIEIALPFLFFSPIRHLRLMSAYAQILLMFVIMLSGNYNFFNLLTCILCLPLLDDKHLHYLGFIKHYDNDIQLIRRYKKLTKILVIITYGIISYYFLTLFNVRINWKTYQISTSIGFTKQQFNDWLNIATTAAIALGLLSLVIEIIKTYLRCWQRTRGIPVWNILSTSLHALIALAMFSLGAITISPLPNNRYQFAPVENVLTLGSEIETYTRNLHLASSYGLFRRMTGVGGRPEVVIEGSNEVDGTYKEYEFYYKPGNRSLSPPVTWFHQPRVDWQMWFAALGHYQNNPWLLNLVHKLLKNDPFISEYISHNPFESKPPKYIKATLYRYHYTKWKSERKLPTNWWIRDKPEPYLPPITKDSKELISYLHQVKILQKSYSHQKSHILVRQILDSIYKYTNFIRPPYFNLAIINAILALKYLT